jgi:hypothetical protein
MQPKCLVTGSLSGATCSAPWTCWPTSSWVLCPAKGCGRWAPWPATSPRRKRAGSELGAWPEFAAGDYATVESIRTLLAGVHSRTEAYLATVDVVDLERIIDAPWNEAIPLRWIVWHVLEHEIHHRGEIYLMLGLMGMEAPDV